MKNNRESTSSRSLRWSGWIFIEIPFHLVKDLTLKGSKWPFKNNWINGEQAAKDKMKIWKKGWKQLEEILILELLSTHRKPEIIASYNVLMWMDKYYTLCLH